MLAKHLAGYLPANLVQAVVGFGTIAVLTRVLSPEDYGRWALVFATVTLGHNILMTWVEAAAVRFYAAVQGKPEEKDHFATLLRLYGLSAAVTGVLTALGLFYLRHDLALQLALGAAFGGALGRSALRIALETRRAALDVRRYVRVDIVHSLGGFLIGIAAVVWAGAGAAGPYIGMAIAVALCLFIEWPALWTRSVGGNFDVSRARSYAVFGMPVAACVAMQILISSSDRFFIAHYLGEAAVGAYSAGYQLAARPMDILIVWTAMAFVPLMTAAYERDGAEGLRLVSKRAFTTLIALAAPAAVGLALVAEPFAELLVGEGLRAGAAQIAPWIALSSFLGGVALTYFGEGFKLAQKTTDLLLVLAIPVILSVVLNAILIPQFGLNGAVAAAVIAYSIGFVALAWRGCALAPLSLPLGDVWRVALACAGMAAIVFLVPTFGGLIELALKAITGAIVYGSLALILNIGGIRDWTTAWWTMRSIKAPA